MNRMIGKFGVMTVLVTGMVGTAAAQAPAAPQFTVSGVGYAQWNYNLSGDQHINRFEVTRTYLNFNGRFANGVSTRVTPDIYRNGDGSAAFRLKYGYVAYQPNAGNWTWKFGMIQTPWVGREEDLWDYRMQGTIALDRNGYLTSSDMGISTDGKLMDGKLDLNVGIYNGEGYNDPEVDQRKDVTMRASYRLSDTDDNSAMGGLRLSGYVGIGLAGPDDARNRYVGMLSYRSTRLTLAGEYAMTNDGVGDGVDGSVITAFGVYRLTDSKLAFIGRFDKVDPDTETDDDANTRIIAGASYQVSPNLRALVDVDLLSNEAGDPDLAIDPRNQFLFQLQFTY